MYHCAQLDQRQRKPKKKEDVKSRDKCQMDTYACHGWMHITVSSALPYLLVKVNHDVKHTPYWNHDIPDDVKDLIKNNPQWTTRQVL
ncbi:hypothetical protein BKA70DRAFT_1101920 [Coprinopsis sp. MPI-PUGE-AT-0042]|nr:hypothetical protein BKA70DRAFT_1101920 [Coprinopsis sp. MPI-PUGE-AT-0042]